MQGPVTIKRRLSLKRRVLFAGIVVLSPVLALLLLEGGLRVYFFAKYHEAGRSYGLWTSHPKLGAIHMAHGYNSTGVTNDQGFRNMEDVLEPRPPGALRVIACGGSTTFCYDIHSTKAWPICLQETLRARRPGGEHDQVLNAGAVMWSISHVFARAELDVPRLKPDYVILYSGINEVFNERFLRQEGLELESLVASRRFGVFAKSYPQNSWWNRNSLAYKAISERILTPLASLGSRETASDASNAWPTEPIPALLENYLEVLRRFLELVRAQGGTPIFVVQISGRDTQMNRYLVSYSREGAKLANALGAVVVDPSPILQGPEQATLFSASGVHYSELGSRRLAEHLYEAVFTDALPR